MTLRISKSDQIVRLLNIHTPSKIHFWLITAGIIHQMVIKWRKTDLHYWWSRPLIYQTSFNKYLWPIVIYRNTQLKKTGQTSGDILTCSSCGLCPGAWGRTCRPCLEERPSLRCPGWWAPSLCSTRCGGCYGNSRGVRHLTLWSETRQAAHEHWRIIRYRLWEE